MKKKILVLTSTFPRWSNDPDPPFVHDLSKHLLRQFEVHVLAPHTMGARYYENIDGLNVTRFKYAPTRLEKLAYNGGIVSNLKRNPVKFLLIGPFILSEFFNAYKIIKLHDIEAIHAHWIIPQGLVAVMLKLLLRSPPSIMCTAHGADVYTQNGKLLTSIKRFILNNCNCISVVSQAMKINVEEMGVYQTIYILPMGTNLSTKFTPAQNGQQKQQIIFVGRLVEKKGASYLLDAFYQLHKDYPEYKLLIIGDGPDKMNLVEHSIKLGIDRFVEFKGGLHHDELPAHYQSSQIAVFPFITTNYGDQEGFGLVLVEAMGCRCCVVATDINTVKDIIRHNETGLVVKEKDSDAIHKAIKELINNPDQMKDLAQNGRIYVADHFDWENIAENYVGIFSRLTKSISDEKDQENLF